MSEERFEVFGNIIKDNEDIPALLDNYLATVRLNELNDKVKELEQELAELKDKDNYHLRYELAGADETITNLKKQLEEKDKEIEKLNKTLEMCKHIERYDIGEMFLENAKLIIEKRQFAIQELEKVKNKCNGMYELWLDSNYKENMYNNEDIAGVFEDISVFTNDLIKKLKGE